MNGTAILTILVWAIALIGVITTKDQTRKVSIVLFILFTLVAVISFYNDFDASLNEKIDLELFYDGTAVSGKTVPINEYNRFIIPLQKISIKNTGNNSAKDLSIKIHFSRELKKYSEMSPTGASELIHGWSISNSSLEGYVSVLEFNEKISLHPDDAWNRPYILVLNFDKSVKEISSVSAKVSVYYGEDQPLEVDFILKPDIEES